MSINTRVAIILSIVETREKYGREIRDKYEELAKAQMPYGSLYTTLDRMEKSGLIKGRDGEPNPELGGNRRRFYSITGKGISAIRSYRESAQIIGGVPNVATA